MHGTFITPSLSSFTQNFTIFLAATFALYVFILFQHRYHHITCLIRSPITSRSVWLYIRHTPFSHIHNHSHALLPPSTPHYFIHDLFRILNLNIHIHSSHLPALLLDFTVVVSCLYHGPRNVFIIHCRPWYIIRSFHPLVISHRGACVFSLFT